jgi:hypothetical protein
LTTQQIKQIQKAQQKAQEKAAKAAKKKGLSDAAAADAAKVQNNAKLPAGAAATANTPAPSGTLPQSTVPQTTVPQATAPKP